MVAAALTTWAAGLGLGSYSVGKAASKHDGERQMPRQAAGNGAVGYMPREAIRNNDAVVHMPATGNSGPAGRMPREAAGNSDAAGRMP
ncbi:hypothetical protein FRX31_022929 [Thalictrum thalictroides]|uniref:Uncharacterized protein n=1 Tax=Thalictrum thalictroides TaxID=46969 RepID=A0A7J6VQY4_THATH|nr:hypothetical protein FRX31_022929 [Thalictrum thalictroides]